jgi:hypothetical protein
VSEQIANRAHRRSFALKADGIGVPECMGVNALVDSGAPGESWQQTSDIGIVDMSAFEGAEERGLSGGDEPCSNVEPPLDERGCTGVEADHARLPAFATPDVKNTIIEANVGGYERQCFADSQAAAPKDGDQRGVANPGRGATRAGTDYCLGVGRGEDVCRQRRMCHNSTSLLDDDGGLTTFGPWKSFLGSMVYRGGRPSGRGRCSSAHCSTSVRFQIVVRPTRATGSGNSGRAIYLNAVTRLIPSISAISVGPTRSSAGGIACSLPSTEADFRL